MMYLCIQYKYSNMLSTYVVVTIDSKLTLKEQVKIIAHNANSVLAFLCCNLKRCSLYIKSKCYLETVRPIIQYAYILWAPCIAQDINKVEMVLRRLHCNKYYHCVSVTVLLELLGLPTLQARRNYIKLLLTYIQDS